MKMKKKLSLLLLCFLMTLGVLGLSGCGKPEFESLGDVKEPSNVEEGSYGGLTADYDADKWQFDNILGKFALYDKETYQSGSDSVENVNAGVTGPYDKELTKDDMDELMEQLEAIGASSGFKIVSNEMRSLDGKSIIYYESETKLSDELLDLLISEGSITEFQIEALGGREYLTSQPASLQVGMSTVIDGNLVTLTGTYNDDPKDVIEAMKLIIKTGKVA